MDGSGHDFLLAADKAFWLDELHESLRLGGLAVDAFEEQGNLEGLVTALQNRSMIHRELFHLGDYLGHAKAAHSDAGVSLAIVEKNHLGFLYGLSCFHFAESEMLLRNYEEAIIYFEQALMSFHHSGVLAQKGHYGFRLGEAQYRVADPKRKGYAREMMGRGLSQLHTDASLYPFPYISLLLVQDHMTFASFLLQERRGEESRRHIEESEKLLSSYPDLLISRRKFETMREGIVDRE
jgi:tetratricopeptide (TPR) repeat protein